MAKRKSVTSSGKGTKSAVYVSIAVLAVIIVIAAVMIVQRREVVAGQAFGSLPQAPVGLVGHWPLEGTGQASYATMVSGTVQGNPTVLSCLTRSCFRFDGVDDVISLGNQGSPLRHFAFTQFNAVTYSFFMYLPPAGGGNVLGAGAQGGLGHGGIYVDLDKVAFSWTPTNPGMDTAITASGLRLRPEQWYQVAVTLDFSRGQYAIYVDGQLKPAVVSRNVVDWRPVSRYNNRQTDAIGARLVNGRWYYFNGGLDEVSVWNRVLSVSELNALWGRDLGPAPSGSSSSGAPACVDSDGGRNTDTQSRDIRGVTSDGAAVGISAESCVDNIRLSEYYCDAATGNLVNEVIDCRTIFGRASCRNGVCVRSNSCYSRTAAGYAESASGVDPLFGTRHVVGSADGSVINNDERCVSSTTLTEYSCSGTSLVTQTVDCAAQFGRGAYCLENTRIYGISVQETVGPYGYCLQTCKDDPNGFTVYAPNPGKNPATSVLRLADFRKYRCDSPMGSVVTCNMFFSGAWPISGCREIGIGLNEVYVG